MTETYKLKILEKFYGTRSHIMTLGLGILHFGFGAYQVRSNDGPRWAISIPMTAATVIGRLSILHHRSVNIFKHLLWNRWAIWRPIWTRISCGDSLGWGNKSLLKWPWSHDQDGHHAHMLVKTLWKSSPEPEGRWPWDLVSSIGDVGPTKFVQMMLQGWPWPT